MILNYGFGNFLSFNDNVVFSMIAPSTKVKKRFPDNFVSLSSGYDVNKVAVIVGENAGGKSNFVRSIDYFKSFFNAAEHIATSSFWINTNNHRSKCPKEDDTTQNFYIEITGDSDDIFSYRLVIDYLGIKEEELRYRKKKEESDKPVFSVVRVNVEAICDNTECDKTSCSFQGTVEYKVNISDSDIPNESKKSFEKNSNNNELIGLFVTKVALIGSKKAIKFISLINNDICPETNVINYDLYKSIQKEQRDLEIIKDERFFDIFRIVDFSIVKIDVNEEEPFKKTIVSRKRSDGSIFKRQLVKDSSGVREYFAWAIQLFKVIYENKIIIADEMDRVLNPVLSDRIVALVNGRSHKGQFIFTSHNALHLDLKTYMKEQIYFITKDVETLESDMYSLSAFPEVRYETTKVYEFYLKGVLGGTASE